MKVLPSLLVRMVPLYAGIVSAILTVSPCMAEDVADARSAMAQFQAELQAASDAQMKGDAQATNEHQTKAMERLNEARNIYEKANAAKSRDPQIMRDYADVLTRTGDADLAATALESVTEAQPEDAGAWRDLGRALSLLGQRRASEAVKALRRSLDLDAASPGAANAYVILGRVYWREGLYDLARDSFAHGLATDAGNVGAKLGLVATKIRDGQVRDASDDLDALGVPPPEFAAMSSTLLAESVQQFEQTRRWFPDTAKDHMAYAKILFRVGRAPESLDAAGRAARLGPNDYATWNFIGDISRQLGKTSRAREAYLKSLDINPDQPRTQEALRAIESEQPQK